MFCDEIGKIIERWREISWVGRVQVICAMPFVAVAALVVGPVLFIFWGLKKAAVLFGVGGKNDWSGDPWSLM